MKFLVFGPTQTVATEKPLRKGNTSDASLPSPRSIHAGEGDNMARHIYDINPNNAICGEIPQNHHTFQRIG